MINLNNAKIVFFGTSEFGAIVLTRLCAVNRPLLVITTPDEKTGRHQALTPSPVKNLALAEKIDFWQPEKLDENFTAELKKTSPDLFIVAAYGKIIPQFILDIPQFGAKIPRRLTHPNCTFEWRRTNRREYYFNGCQNGSWSHCGPNPAHKNFSRRKVS